MGKILPFPAAKSTPASGLTEKECDIVHAEAFAMMKQGEVTGVSVHEGGRFMCVFDRQGEPYLIGREQGICYLSNATATMIAHSDRFDYAFEVLQIMLSPSPEASA